ncbi:methyl-accepting chemotaxis protein [Azotosporobacter soli]|uniref:methyl-accepting chemotaxis protein n=1 Tax=Azotosporobacter soli TaxID=3055040 RepID=UPI0031FE77A8
MNKRSLGLTQKLILSFITILLIPSVCIGWFSYKTAYDKVEQAMLENANGNVVMLNHTLDQMIGGTKKEVDFLANRLPLGAIGPVQGDEDAFVRAMLDAYRAKNPEVELAAVGTDKGVYINSPKSAVNPAGYDPRKRPWYMMSSENKGKPTVINPYVSTNSGQVVVTVAQTADDNHGVVSVSLSIKALTDIASQIKIGKEGYIFIVDKNRNMLVHPTIKPGTKNEDALIEEMAKQKNGTIRYEYQGEKKLVFFTTNEMTGWLIAGTMAEAEVAASTRSILLTTAGVIAIFLVVGGILIYLVIGSVRRPLVAMVDAAERICNGDLTVEVPVTSQDELGRVSASFNKMSAALRRFLRQIQQTGDHLSASSEQLSASAGESSQAACQVADAITDVAGSMERQRNSVKGTSAVLEKMTASMGQVAVHNEAVAKQSAKAAAKAVDGSDAISKAVGQMAKIEQTVNSSAQIVAKLGDRSKEIGQIVDTISGIAGQTNLLALNAAIEAARAGEQGRGFAVVADEVRKLAEQSQEAAKQIAALIAEIRTDTDMAVSAMSDGTKEVEMGAAVIHTTGQVFEEITAVVTDVSVKMNDVTADIAQTVSGSEQIIAAMKEIDAMSRKVAEEADTVSAATQEQTASMQEIASASQVLLQSAQNLQDEVNKFRL